MVPEEVTSQVNPSKSEAVNNRLERQKQGGWLAGSGWEQDAIDAGERVFGAMYARLAHQSARVE